MAFKTGAMPTNQMSMGNYYETGQTNLFGFYCVCLVKKGGNKTKDSWSQNSILWVEKFLLIHQLPI